MFKLRRCATGTVTRNRIIMTLLRVSKPKEWAGFYIVGCHEFASMPLEVRGSAIMTIPRRRRDSGLIATRGGGHWGRSQVEHSGRPGGHGPRPGHNWKGQVPRALRAA